jgi:secreted Zn-dependent insulinase-like peptidase
VRNFGVVERGGVLGLDEQRTVYQEMVSSTDQPGSRIRRAALQAMYGDHPLSFNSGGTPEALRILQPDDIRTFHADHYHLANMTAVVAVPRGLALGDVLTRFDGIFARVEPESPGRPVRTAADLPPPAPADAADVRIVDYPYASDQQPCAVWLTWPGARDLDLVEPALLSPGANGA